MLIFAEALAGFQLYFLKGSNGTEMLKSGGHHGSESDYTAQIVSHFTDIWSRTESFRHFYLSTKIANGLTFRLILTPLFPDPPSLLSFWACYFFPHGCKLALKRDCHLESGTFVLFLQWAPWTSYYSEKNACCCYVWERVLSFSI